MELEDLENSLRQEAFKYFDDHPEELLTRDNDNLYEFFHYVPKEKQVILRNYKKEYKQAQAKLKLAHNNKLKEYARIIRIPDSKLVNPLHILDMLRSHPTLPIFIYTKLIKDIVKDYGCSDKDKEREEKHTYSYFDLYMKLFNEISIGKHDKAILEFISNVEEIYGQLCLDLFYQFTEDIKFNPNDLSEDDEVNHKVFVLESKEHLEEMIKHTKYLVKEYSGYTNSDLTKIRIRILWYLFFDFRKHNIFIHYRLKELVKSDIDKICNEYNRCFPGDLLEFKDVIYEYNWRWVFTDNDKKILKIRKENYIDMGDHGKEFLNAKDDDNNLLYDGYSIQLKVFEEYYADLKESWDFE